MKLNNCDFYGAKGMKKAGFFFKCAVENFVNFTPKEKNREENLQVYTNFLKYPDTYNTHTNTISDAQKTQNWVSVCVARNTLSTAHT